MLKNELQGISSLVQQLSSPPYKGGQEAHLTNFRADLLNAARDVRSAWDDAMFSAVSDQSLTRYFKFHVEGIRELLDTLTGLSRPSCLSGLVKEELTGLIGYQLQYFYLHFDLDAVSPPAYTAFQQAKAGQLLPALKCGLKRRGLTGPLKDCLFSYFEQMDPGEKHSRFTFRSLLYLENMIRELGHLPAASKSFDIHHQLTIKLTDLNFNHLAFFRYRQEQISARLRGSQQARLRSLREESAELRLSAQCALSYDPQWPPLSSMLSDWVTEQINAIEREMLPAPAKAIIKEKLFLNLSVAHLACMVKLFFEENLINSANLAEVFRFIAQNYRTKRQDTISPGSLSKEFYSTSQVTAAVVRDMLLKMVARINHNFFPVWVAAGAITVVWSGTL